VIVDAIAGYVFYEIAALLVLAAVVGLVGVLLRQPLVVSYIAVGIAAGPSGLDIARSDEYISLLAELGIAVLLFLVGLKLDLTLVRTLGPVAVMTGLGQVAFTSIFGALIGLALGMPFTTAVYVGIALTFSSTIIIVKLLSDKREIDTLHGRIALGFLIVQDLVVVVAMAVLSATGAGAGEASGLATLTAYGAIGLVALLGFVRFVADPLVERLARSPELLVSFVIGWAALLAALGHYAGFGKELGGLIAGVSLASTHAREAIAARLVALRDFLLLFFFIDLGAALDLSTLGSGLVSAGVFSAFVLIGNPLIVLTIMCLMGYRARTGFLAGLTVAQISEFSLIFMAMGVTLGHVEESALGLVTLVGLVTIAVSTYLITYSYPIYRRLEPLLAPFERLRVRKETAGGGDGPAGDYPDVLLFGLGRYGFGVAHHLRLAGYRVVGIDLDPGAVRRARAAGFEARYGDATDPEFLVHLPIGHVRWALCAIPSAPAGSVVDDPRRALLAALADARFPGRIAVASHDASSDHDFEAAGAALILRPYDDAAREAAVRVAHIDGTDYPEIDAAAPAAV